MNKTVELIAWVQNPEGHWDAEDPASCGARGCFSELSSSGIHKQEIGKTNYQERKEKLFQETAGRNHGAVLDQSLFVYSLDNITRLSTLFLCTPQYASHLQQSLRRATAERGFFIPHELIGTEAEDFMNQQFQLYTEMQNAGIPSEDARFILPLYTKTAIQSAFGARELMHLDSMAQREGVPGEVKDTVKRMMDLAYKEAPRLMERRESNYETLAWMPSSQIFAKENRTIEQLLKDTNYNPHTLLINSSKIRMDSESIKKAVLRKDEAEMANLKHYHFTFLAPMSLVAFHQATRQRTWDQSVQPLQHAVGVGHYITPKSIERTEFEGKYKRLTERVIDFVHERKNEDVLGILPNNVVVYDLIHLNGWNAVYSIGKRTCTKAQWEIRKIAVDMAKKICSVAPELGEYAVPQGITFGRCPEKDPCGLCFKK